MGTIFSFETRPRDLTTNQQTHVLVPRLCSTPLACLYMVKAHWLSVGCAGCLDQSWSSIQSVQQIINGPCVSEMYLLNNCGQQLLHGDNTYCTSIQVSSLEAFALTACPYT